MSVKYIRFSVCVQYTYTITLIGTYVSACYSTIASIT